MNPFVVGQEYSRREDIHRFGGSWQSGISPSADNPMVFLFTGPSGSQYGYRDSWHDGVFWYTGEGRVGDMTLTGGNRAIVEAESKGRMLLLFEQQSKGRATFLGEAHYIRHHMEAGPDQTGKPRRVIVFELAVDGSSIAGAVPGLREEQSGRDRRSQKEVSIEELRRQALAAAPSNASADSRLKNVYARSRAVRLYVLRRANGICENCGLPAPFKARSGELYLEPHHIRRVADDGPDHPRWVAAICPNCHREIHYGMAGVEINQRLRQKLGAIEVEG